MHRMSPTKKKKFKDHKMKDFDENKRRRKISSKFVFLFLQVERFVSLWKEMQTDARQNKEHVEFVPIYIF